MGLCMLKIKCSTWRSWVTMRLRESQAVPTVHSQTIFLGSGTWLSDLGKTLVSPVSRRPADSCSSSWAVATNQSQKAFGVTLGGEFSSAINDCGHWWGVALVYWMTSGSSVVERDWAGSAHARLMGLLFWVYSFPGWVGLGPRQDTLTAALGMIGLWVNRWSILSHGPIISPVLMSSSHIALKQSQFWSRWR